MIRGPTQVGWSPPGDESFGEPLREQERGEAVPRADMPHRDRGWCPGAQEKGYDCGDRHQTIPSRRRTGFNLTASTTVKTCFSLAPPPRVGCETNLVLELHRASSPGGKKRQQTKPFIVEMKRSRKPKTGIHKPSIWGKLDLSVADSPMDHLKPVVEPATAKSGDRP